MKSFNISSRNGVGCKIVWELKLKYYKDSVRVVLVRIIAKLNHLLLSALDGIEWNVPTFQVGVDYCSSGYKTNQFMM
jgi:hypothetical protein